MYGLKNVVRITTLLLMCNVMIAPVTRAQSVQAQTLKDQICGFGVPVEITTGGINLRAEATTSSAVVGQTTEGQTLTVIGGIANGQAINGDTRWLNLEDVDGDGESDWVLGNLILPSTSVEEIIAVECTAADLLPLVPISEAELNSDHINPNTLTIITDTGDEYPWANTVSPEMEVRIERAIALQLQMVSGAYGIQEVSIFAFDNGRSGGDVGFQWSILPFSTDDDGNMNLYWPYETEAGLLRYNPALPPFQAGRSGIARIKIPTGLDVLVSFNSAGSRPILLVSQNGQNRAILNVTRPVQEGNPATLFEALGNGPEY